MTLLVRVWPQLLSPHVRAPSPATVVARPAWCANAASDKRRKAQREQMTSPTLPMPKALCRRSTAPALTVIGSFGQSARVQDMLVLVGRAGPWPNNNLGPDEFAQSWLATALGPASTLPNRGSVLAECRPRISQVLAQSHASTRLVVAS